MVSLPGRRDAAPYNERLRIRRTGCLPLVLLPGRRDAAPYKEMLRICRTGCLSSVLLRNVGDDVPYIVMLRIRRGWRFTFVAAARRAGVGAPYMEAFRMRRTIEFVEGALTHSLPQRGRVSPTRATGEGERDGTALWK